MDILRGDIFYVFKGGYVVGSEIDSGRPAVIVSNNIGNENSNIVQIVYLTSQEKTPMPTHCEVLCHVPSVAICEQVCTVSKNRIGNWIRKCTDQEMKAIDECLKVSLALNDGCSSNRPEDAQLKNKLTEAKDTIRAMSIELDCLRKMNGDAGERNVQLGVERDLYKNLYEQMLDKLLKAV